MKADEIKFRAQREDGKGWVYGDLVHHYSIKMGKRTDHVSIGVDLDFYEVVPETVCQWTGLKDKNGVKIYEGDVVIFGKLLTAIKYFEKYGMFGLVGKSQYRKYDENEPMGSGGSSTSYKPYVLSEYYQKRIEVIGNIHDKAQQKQALIDMMRGDEEIGLYGDNPPPPQKKITDMSDNVALRRNDYENSKRKNNRSYRGGVDGILPENRLG